MGSRLLLRTKHSVMLSGGGVQRSGTPAESKHSYPNRLRKVDRKPEGAISEFLSGPLEQCELST